MLKGKGEFLRLNVSYLNVIKPHDVFMLQLLQQERNQTSLSDPLQGLEVSLEARTRPA